ncbi:MAG TPA: TonB-dependent receptor, partial [Planctomycetota bacterium]|nr:TonB-dependent receptor [Planctomycetota bacterium]
NDPPAGFSQEDLRIDERWNTVTWNVGGVFWLTEELGLAANVASGFRAPTTSDTVSIGPPVFSSRTASLPSPGVEPEKSITYEVGPRYQSSDVSAAVTFYWTQLYDIIAGHDAGQVVIQGVTYTARQNDNSGHGYIRGVEAAASVRLFDDFTLFGNLTFTESRDKHADAPFRFIPPLNGLVGLHWDHPSRRFWAEGVVVMVDRLARHAPDDELDAGFSTDPGLGSPGPANPPLRKGFEIPGYAVVNLRGGAEVYRGERSSMRITLDVNNLFNMHYREAYAQQQLEAPGIGAVLGVEVKF